MKSTLSSSLAITLANLVSLLMAASCRAQPSKEELRSFMESTSFVALMGYQNYTNLQVGYTQSPGGIEGGDFL
jgi:hypothetical protein